MSIQRSLRRTQARLDKAIIGPRIEMAVRLISVKRSSPASDLGEEILEPENHVSDDLKNGLQNIERLY